MLDYSKPTPPLPPLAQMMAKRILHEWKEMSCKEGRDSQLHVDPLNQLTINEYIPGQGIASHTDTKSCFGEIVFILNMGSGITMNLTKCKDRDGDDRDGGGRDYSDGSCSDSNDIDPALLRKCIFLPARSLVREVIHQ